MVHPRQVPSNKVPVITSLTFTLVKPQSCVLAHQYPNQHLIQSRNEGHAEKKRPVYVTKHLRPTSQTKRTIKKKSFVLDFRSFQKEI